MKCCLVVQKRAWEVVYNKGSGNLINNVNGDNFKSNKKVDAEKNEIFNLLCITLKSSK
jgi:hypothetical protein